MQSTQKPTLIPLAFAANGTKNAIPEASQIGITDGAASLNDGFPPLTMTPIAAGGKPPSGADMNGVLNLLSQSIRWQHAGGQYAWNSTFVTDTNVAGYPAGAHLMRADGTGFWLNTADNNETNPDATDGSAANWVPGYNYGVTAITGLTNANVTLQPLQAAKSKITLAGALTGNIQIIFPAWTKEWEVVNNTTGAFSITAITAAGTGVILASGQQKITGDGTNITQPPESIAAPIQTGQAAQVAQIQSGETVYAHDTGTANAYVIDLSPAPESLSPGMIVGIDNIVAGNTGPSTLNVDATGNVQIVGPDGSALQGGELVAGYGALFRLSHSGAAWELIWTSGGATPIAPATNSKHAMQLGQAVGRLLNIQVFTSSGTYTPTVGTKNVRVRCQGGGGGGGGTPATGAGQAAAGGGGGSGAYAESWISAPGPETVTVGAGGTGAIDASGNGGGYSSFGSLVVAGGGAGGGPGAIVSTYPQPGPAGGAPGTVSAGGNVVATPGANGPYPMLFSSNAILAAAGAHSMLGNGGNYAINGAGNAALGYGAGGSGSSVYASQGVSLAGGNGSAGLVIVEEYA